MLLFDGLVKYHEILLLYYMIASVSGQYGVMDKGYLQCVCTCDMVKWE